jgi:hypothetical protein
VRINGVGKLVAAFVFFLAASALAIHESKPPPAPRDEIAPAIVPPVDATPPSRAIHDEVPPWVKYAAPAPAPPRAPPPLTITVAQIPPRHITIDESTIELVDVVDKCPDQPTDRDDNDGCPEPEGLRDRIIEIE